MIDIDELEKEDRVLKEIKQEKPDATDSNESELCKIYDINKLDYRIATKNFELNQQIETYLQEVGTLIVHPDVVYALQHIKDLGAMMRKQNQSEKNLSQSTDNVLSRNLFPEPEETQRLHTSDTIASHVTAEVSSLMRLTNDAFRVQIQDTSFWFKCRKLRCHDFSALAD